MKQTPKQFFSTPAGKLTLAIIAMVLCWTVLIVYISSNAAGGTLFPTEAHMTRIRQEIKKNTTTLNNEEKELQAFDDLEDRYEASLTTFWNADRDGQPETELRNLINDAAERAKANLQTLGSVRTSNINGELSYADLDFTVVDEYDKVIRFFAEVEKCTPRLAWRRVELRVEPTRARAVTAPGAARTGTTAATAQVRVVKYSPAGNSSAKTGTATAAKTGAATTAATKPATTTPATTTPAATSSTPAAQQPEEKAAAPADAPAKTEPAANDATTNKENGK